VRVWDIANLEVLHTIQAHGSGEGDENEVWTSQFSPDGMTVLSGAEENLLKLWNVKTGQAAGSPLDSGGGEFYSCCFSPDSQLLMASSEDIKIWDVATGELVSTLAVEAGPAHVEETASTAPPAATCCAFSPDGSLVVSADSDDLFLKLWTMSTGKLLRIVGSQVILRLKVELTTPPPPPLSLSRVVIFPI
jgi:WD40 repeat protein